MAKSGFWLRGSKGKLAGTVLYQSQGSTIQREIVTPKNPQSDNQMRQRVAFAGASKFYQNAQQNRFVLAFPNKKGNQSEFNAFMQKNLKEFGTLTYPTREQANTPEFCNYFPWICTEGNLQSIPAAFPDDNTGSLGAGITVRTNNNYFTSWDDLIAANPTLNLQYGDIITVTVVINDEVYSDATLDVVVGNITPRWITRQIIIGADLNGYTLEQYFTLNGFSYLNTADNKEVMAIDLDTVCAELGINPGNTNLFVTTEVAAMVCVTRSRREGIKLKVSPSRFYLTDMAQRIFERLSNDTQIREAIDSYKKSANSQSTPANILQGSVEESFRTSLALVWKVTGKGTAQGVEVPLPNRDFQADGVPYDGYKEATILFKSNGKNWQQSDLASVVVTVAEGVTANKYIVEGESTDLVVQMKVPSSVSDNKTYSISIDGIVVISGNIDYSFTN